MKLTLYNNRELTTRYGELMNQKEFIAHGFNPDYYTRKSLNTGDYAVYRLINNNIIEVIGDSLAGEWDFKTYKKMTYEPVYIVRDEAGNVI